MGGQRHEQGAADLDIAPAEIECNEQDEFEGGMGRNPESDAADPALAGLDDLRLARPGTVDNAMLEDSAAQPDIGQKRHQRRGQDDRIHDFISLTNYLIG